jgi:hypothetical protein
MRLPYVTFRVTECDIIIDIIICFVYISVNHAEVHCPTSLKVAGSIPNDIMGFIHLHDPSGCIMVLVLTQPLTEISTRYISCG